MKKLNIGMPSIVVIFFILCMTSFATLSYVTAHNDYKLTNTSVQHTIDYHNASSKAEEQLAILDEITVKAESSNDFYRTVQKLCKQTSNILVQNQNFSYEIDMNDTQKLCVSGIVSRETNSNHTHFTVKQWSIVLK
jgi:fructose-1,6-bisphosphatase